MGGTRSLFTEHIDGHAGSEGRLPVGRSHSRECTDGLMGIERVVLQIFAPDPLVFVKLQGGLLDGDFCPDARIVANKRRWRCQGAATDLLREQVDPVDEELSVHIAPQRDKSPLCECLILHFWFDSGAWRAHSHRLKCSDAAAFTASVAPSTSAMATIGAPRRSWAAASLSKDRIEGF